MLANGRGSSTLVFSRSRTMARNAFDSRHINIGTGFHYLHQPFLKREARECVRESKEREREREEIEEKEREREEKEGERENERDTRRERK
jgi:hypothetical protein